MNSIDKSAREALAWITSHGGEPLGTMRSMKFEPIGFHPIYGHDLNLIEQINQTWTFVTAIAATRHLLTLHPEAGGFYLAPGAYASQPLDIMSVANGLVGAETCAVVHPNNNGKRAKDIAKLSERSESHRYWFFMCPKYPGLVRRKELEKNGIQVWSVDV